MKCTPFLFALFVLTPICCSSAEAETARSAQSMVATVDPLATTAALDAMRNGGNAIDAAVAAALTLGVVDCQNSGIGGGCFILIRLADGTLVAIDGRETAPAAATRDMYLRDGRPQTALSQTGSLAVATPGALAAYAIAVERYGKRNLSDLLNPAADIAEEGFEIDGMFAARLLAATEEIASFPTTRRTLLKEDGTPYRAGETLRLPQLATTYRAIAEHGTDWFYQGSVARSIGEWMADHGGILTADDFAAYEPKIRQPIQSSYRDATIIGFPPPSSGGIHVAQILNMLENVDLAELYHDDPVQYTHVVAEAMKRAFADRAHWLGDSDFADVPLGLLDQQYADELFQQIDPDMATAVETHGTPAEAATRLIERHTTHICVVDEEGNWVSITATINTSFGSKVIVPGTGILLNNEMDDFSVAPGVPNAFGLVGSEANAIEPGKRPLSSMSPTIVLRNGEPVLTVGAAGGPRIISQVVLTIINRLDLGMPLEEAVASKRFHHQWSPDVLHLERGTDEALIEALHSRGHETNIIGYVGVMQAIALDDDGKTLLGVHDPRVPGSAAGGDSAP